MPFIPSRKRTASVIQQTNCSIKNNGFVKTAVIMSLTEDKCTESHIVLDINNFW